MLFNDELAQTIADLKSGNIIAYPTDTVWGLGCDATNAEAVKKIFKLKNRAESKSLVILMSSLTMLQEYIPEIPEKVLTLLSEADKPTTIIYNNPKGLAANVVASDNTVAVRIPKHDFCIELVKRFGKPIVSTSANLSGEPTPKSYADIHTTILEGVDYVVDLQREKLTEKSSTILKLLGDKILVIRP
jgi:L-threonylcarbamoyladenylate synthase